MADPDARTVATDQAGLPTQALPAAAGLGPGSRLGAYRIDDRLGEGGMGVVWRGRHAVLERAVAIKVMRRELAGDATWRDRFLREARAAAAVTHQNVVVIHDAGEQDGQAWLAFQFVAGGSLDQVIASRGTLPAPEALRLIAACADGLQAIHEAGLVHRDIKPHNVFLDARGRPLLGDFGLARAASGDDRLTVTGQGLGTPAYMSPEQARGEGDLDIRSDIHALGATLHCLLTGKPPFAGATPWMVVDRVVNGPVPDPREHAPGVPAHAAEVLMTAMAKRRDERFAEPAVLAAACRAAADAIEGRVPASPSLSAATAGGSLLGPFAGHGWIPLAAYALGLLPLAFVLGPFAGLHHGYRPPDWSQPAFWGGWMLLVALQGLALWVPLRVLAGRSGRALALRSGLAMGLHVGLLAAFAVAALDAWGDPGLVAWPALASAAGIFAFLGWMAWGLWRIFQPQADPAQLVRQQALRLLQIAGLAVVLVVVAHLFAVPADVPAEERRRGLLDRVFSDSEGQDRGRSLRSATHAASAVAWGIPLALGAIGPAVLLLRRRRLPGA